MKSKTELIADEALKFKPKKILDVGYAQVPNPLLGKEGAEVYGVDIVNVSADGCGTLYMRLEYHQASFKDGEVDLVAMGCTLAHVASPLRVLARMKSNIKPEGILIISSPNPNYYWENILNIFYHRFKNRVSKAKHIEHFLNFLGTTCAP